MAPEPLGRFARAHLRTPAQQAVYQTVASDPEATWSAAEIAAHTRLAHHDIGQVLRSFAAAGILRETASPGRDRRYRWRPELRYLLDGSAPRAEFIDPVCGMPVDPDTPHTGRDASGALVRFCSPYCGAAYRGRRRRA